MEKVGCQETELGVSTESWASNEKDEILYNLIYIHLYTIYMTLVGISEDGWRSWGTFQSSVTLLCCDGILRVMSSKTQVGLKWSSDKAQTECKKHTLLSH